mmetsp:Transcript_12028/g.39523  ORF Transcript_12028/g.39523 Transcript_12028/m.39523 type:complete len:85 (+) Transcript_12028:366-620(+)
MTSDCCGDAAYASWGFVAMDACGLLPSAERATKCALGEGFVHADVVTAALQVLGSDVLYLEVISKADATARDGFLNIAHFLCVK